MEKPHNPEETLFDAARVLKEPAQRAAFLNAACQGNEPLRQRVEQLLADASQAADYFDQIAPKPADFGLEKTVTESETLVAPGVELGEGPGSQVGKYKLLQQIGEGGMGVVYLAAEEGALHRKVAFKIIKLGMDTKSVVARFEAERQALALMDHRNIAKVFDAGATDTGRPFFVMELVKGIPITEYCDKQKLTTEQRLELFIPVCEAIQHAHHKGIIHRDIKPSNVMVAHFDGKPVPMVIDFGIAKATHQRLTEKTQWTEYGQFIGTPAYVSPEQAEGSQLDIDTRSDLYSLGVLLYELLTGSTPFPDKRLRSAGWKEMQRIILEDEPDKPSTRLSTLSEEERTTLNKAHPEGLGRISLLLRRELDWVVMKCLEKDRNRRYETASQLAQELANYLKGEALIAMPPSGWYRFSKLARKHKKTFAMAAGIAVILAVATVISTYQSIVAKRERDVAQAVSDFLDKDLLQRADVYGSDPFTTPHRDLLLLEVVNRASTNLHGKFTNQPVVEASIRLTLGKIFVGLGELLVAEEHLERSLELFQRTLGDGDLRTAEAAHYLGRLQTLRFKVKEAEVNLRKAVRIRQHLLGEFHPDVFESRNVLAKLSFERGDGKEAFELSQKLFQDAELHLESTDDTRLSIMTTYARGLKPDEQLSMLDKVQETLVAKHGSNHMRAFMVEDERAYVIGVRKGEGMTAMRMWEDLWQRMESKLGVSAAAIHPMLRTAIHYVNQGLANKGRALSQSVLELDLKMSGTNHPMVYQSKMFLGWIERRYLSPKEEIRYFEDVFADVLRVGGNPIVKSQLLNDLQKAYWNAGEFEKTLNASRQTIVLQHELGWPRDSQFLTDRLVLWLVQLGRWEEAAGHRFALLSLPENVRDDPKRDHFHAAVILAVVGRTNEAATSMRERLKDFTPDPKTLEPVLIAALVLNELSAEARTTLIQPGPVSALTAPELLNSGLALYRQGDFAGAAKRLRLVFEHAPNPQLAAFAGYYLALSLRPTDPQQAAAILESANARLERIHRRGVIGVWPEWNWFWSAFNLIARDEAERGVLGEVRSAPANPAYFTRMREQWKPVGDLLDIAGQHCRHQRWAEARVAYREALNHPYFSWEAAGEDGGNIRLAMALAFMRAGDQSSYLALCEPSPPEEFLAPLGHFSVSLDLRHFADRRLILDWNKMPDTHPSAGGFEWRAALSGFADYAADRNLENLATTFAAAAEKCFHWGRRTVGLALGAATQAKLGNREQARKLLTEAETKWQELNTNNLPDRAAYWPELTFAELALEEARRQVGKGTVAASK